MITKLLKSVLPNRPVSTPVLRGPFRGARIVMNPSDSLRKVFGVYEHELNPWLEAALARTTRVLDVGANDGYFTFGCAAAFRRLRKEGSIIGFECQDQHVRKLRESVAELRPAGIKIDIVQALVGQEVSEGTTTLDALDTPDRNNTLVKIDVEGAEMEVVAGAQTWFDPSNLFVIEVHEERFLAELIRNFASHQHQLRQVDQRPLPLLGREARDLNNWWLVSELT